MEEFKQEIADMRLRDPATSRLRTLLRLGVLLMAAQFLRFWLARLTYEHQAQPDRIIEALARK